VLKKPRERGGQKSRWAAVSEKIINNNYYYYYQYLEVIWELLTNKQLFLAAFAHSASSRM
jgi:hypothetical protein